MSLSLHSLLVILLLLPHPLLPLHVHIVHVVRALHPGTRPHRRRAQTV